MAKRTRTKRTRTTNPQPYDALPELVTPEEAGAFLRVSRNGIYELLRRGDLPSLKFGRLIRIRKTALLEGGR